MLITIQVDFVHVPGMYFYGHMYTKFFFEFSYSTSNVKQSCFRLTLWFHAYWPQKKNTKATVFTLRTEEFWTLSVLTLEAECFGIQNMF